MVRSLEDGKGSEGVCAYAQIFSKRERLRYTNEGNEKMKERDGERGRVRERGKERGGETACWRLQKESRRFLFPLQLLLSSSNL